MGPTGFRYASIYARLISHIFLGFSGPTTHLTKTRSGFKKVNVKIGDHQTFSSSSMPTIIFVATIGNIYSRFGHYSRSVLKIFQNNTIKTFIPSRIFPLLLCKPTVCSSITHRRLSNLLFFWLLRRLVVFVILSPDVWIKWVFLQTWLIAKIVQSWQ